MTIVPGACLVVRGRQVVDGQRDLGLTEPGDVALVLGVSADGRWVEVLLGERRGRMRSTAFAHDCHDVQCVALAARAFLTGREGPA